jgi:hypothetical protein
MKRWYKITKRIRWGLIGEIYVVKIEVRDLLSFQRRTIWQQRKLINLHELTVASSDRKSTEQNNISQNWRAEWLRGEIIKECYLFEPNLTQIQKLKSDHTFWLFWDRDIFVERFRLFNLQNLNCKWPSYSWMLNYGYLGCYSPKVRILKSTTLRHTF